MHYMVHYSNQWWTKKLKPMLYITTFLFYLNKIRFAFWGFYQTSTSHLVLKNHKDIFILTLIALVYCKINLSYSIDCGRQALDVANALAANNLPEAERLLQLLQNRPLTAQQIQDLNNIINRAVETRAGPGAVYQVQDFELQNAGDPSREPFNFRGLLLTLAVIGSSILTIYLILHYWEDVQDFLFGSARTIAPHTIPVLRTVLLARYELVRQDPYVVQELFAYFDNLPKD